MKDLVLVYHWHIDDGWYGKNYRAILSIEKNKGFQSKKDISKFKTLFRNQINKRFINSNLQAKNKDMIIGERKEFKSYIYCANGPSLSYTHFDITTEDIKNKKE